jgi:ATP-dependent Clp protease ATP-binding subunit ClpA
MFNSLTKEHIHKIIDVELIHLYKRITDLGYKIKLSDDAKISSLKEVTMSTSGKAVKASHSEIPGGPDG